MAKNPVQMHKIYSLSDPRNKRVFYVGATVRPLNARLGQHCKRPNWKIGKTLSAKLDLIEEIISSGRYPNITLLKTTDNKVKWEAYYYRKFVREGNVLLQSLSALGL